MGRYSFRNPHTEAAKRKMSRTHKKQGTRSHDYKVCQCVSCKSRRGEMKGKNNSHYGCSHTVDTKRRLSEIAIERYEKNPDKHPFRIDSQKTKRVRSIRRASIEHHIDLKENSDRILKLSRSHHQKLHQRAYDYVVKMGKIDNYIKWFLDKYGDGL